MGVVRSISLLVGRMLAGQEMLVRMLVEYAWERCSISDVAYNAGVSKHVARGVFLRLGEVLGSPAVARAFLRRFGPYILSLRVKPIVENMGGVSMCLLCGFVCDNALMIDHIHKRHGDLVKRYVEDVIDLVRYRAPIQAIAGDG